MRGHVPVVEPPALSARRATLADLPALQELWQRTGLPSLELERYVAEFQVVSGEGEQRLLAAIGLLVEGNEALLHTEAIADPELADELRAGLWRRVQIVARNQGVQRIWTQEDAEYWRTGGFGQPTPQELTGATASFVDSSAAWLVCPLGHPAKAGLHVNEQMAIWQTARSQETQEFQTRIRRFRNFALCVAALVTIAACALFLYVFLRHPETVQRLLHR